MVCASYTAVKWAAAGSKVELELLQFTGHFALGAGDAYKIGFVALERLSGDY